MSIQTDIRRVITNWMNPEYIRLHAGKMTPEAVRAVRAVVQCVGTEIDLLIIGAPALTDGDRKP